MADTATIIDSRRVPSVDGNRLGKFDRLITFKTGPGQVHLIVLPDESATDSAIETAIKNELRVRGTHVGKTFTL